MIYEFTYQSDEAAQITNQDLCQKLDVTVAVDVNKDRTDTPLGPTPWFYHVGPFKVLSLKLENGSDFLPKMNTVLAQEIAEEIESREQNIIDAYCAK
jgi:hypothetical protein